MTNLPDNLPETADIETSSEDYARRFSGAIGAWMLSVQERIVRKLLSSRCAPSLLDVGGGHGQLANPLCASGFDVTVFGSADSCRNRIEPALRTGRCTFRTGNVVDLPFPDGSFDVTLCFRLLPHCERWPTLIAELCRVSRQAVIVDYPTSESINRIAPFLFDAKKKLEGNTRAWRSFTHTEVEAEFARHGFVVARREKEFFLPMALHRTLRFRGLSALLEGFCRLLGVTRRWGSPVIVEMARDHKSAP